MLDSAITDFLKNADTAPIFYKRLSHNDISWANQGTHQGGVLIPLGATTFFGIDHGAERIFKCTWHSLEQSTITTESRVKIYNGGNRANRPECHFTRLPRQIFQDLTSGGYLFLVESETGFQCLVLSNENEHELEELLEWLNIPTTLWGVTNAPQDDIEEIFRREATSAYTLAGGLPSTNVMANLTWDFADRAFLALVNEPNFPLSTNTRSLNTGMSKRPGDLIRWLHSSIEFKLFRHIEEIHYPIQFIQVLQDHYSSDDLTWPHLTIAATSGLNSLIDVGKTITQSRRARAGKSFEHHIARILSRENLQFHQQVGAERLDFLVEASNGDSIRVSAKTTARERWRQVPSECFFLTLDAAITLETIDYLEQNFITLVVPEYDKREILKFANTERVISFHDFLCHIKA